MNDLWPIKAWVSKEEYENMLGFRWVDDEDLTFEYFELKTRIIINSYTGGAIMRLGGLLADQITSGVLGEGEQTLLKFAQINFIQEARQGSRKLYELLQDVNTSTGAYGSKVGSFKYASIEEMLPPLTRIALKTIPLMELIKNPNLNLVLAEEEYVKLINLYNNIVLNSITSAEDNELALLATEKEIDIYLNKQIKAIKAKNILQDGAISDVNDKVDELELILQQIADDIGAGIVSNPDIIIEFETPPTLSYTLEDVKLNDHKYIELYFQCEEDPLGTWNQGQVNYRDNEGKTIIVNTDGMSEPPTLTFTSNLTTTKIDITIPLGYSLTKLRAFSGFGYSINNFVVEQNVASTSQIFETKENSPFKDKSQSEINEILNDNVETKSNKVKDITQIQVSSIADDNFVDFTLSETPLNFNDMTIVLMEGGNQEVFSYNMFEELINFNKFKTKCYLETEAGGLWFKQIVWIEIDVVELTLTKKVSEIVVDNTGIVINSDVRNGNIDIFIYGRERIAGEIEDGKRHIKK